LVCDLDLVTESFLLLTDPYHKQVYQLPASDQLDVQVVRGVAMPTDAQFPTSVDVSPDQGLVYWIDSSARRILSTHFTDDRHHVKIAELPLGWLIARIYVVLIIPVVRSMDRQGINSCVRPCARQQAGYGALQSGDT